jgi:hypothetical protein
MEQRDVACNVNVALGYPYTHLHVLNMRVAKQDGSSVPRVYGTVHKCT